MDFTNRVLTAAVHQESTYYHNTGAKIKYHTFSTVSDGADLRSVAQKIIDTNPKEKILILSGVHSANPSYPEAAFRCEDERSVLALGSKNAEVLDVAKSDEDAILSKIYKMQPDRIIWASCNSDRDTMVPNLLGFLGFER